MKTASYSAKKGRFLIEALVQEVGEDLLVSIWGGTRPHIGAVGIAEPRPSLQDSRRFSATSSNFTFTGHKEDRLVKEISEVIAASLRKNVVVTAGIHWDGLKPRELLIVENLARQLARKICRAAPHPPTRTSAASQPRAGEARSPILEVPHDQLERAAYRSLAATRSRVTSTFPPSRGMVRHSKHKRSRS